MEIINRKIDKYILDYRKVFTFFIDHILWKELSIKISNKIEFKDGLFYTLLPKDAVVEKLYDLSSGNMIPPVPSEEIDYKKDGSEFHVQKVLTLDSELTIFIHDYLIKNNNSFVIIEDTHAESSDKNLEIEGVDTVFYNKDVYYVINSQTTIESIWLTLRRGSSDWHALIVFVKGMGSLPIHLKQNDFDEICKNLTHIVTTAYDGESYIFWERNNLK